MPRDTTQFPDVKTSTTYFGAKFGQGGAVFPGGLDLLTPPLQLHPGACRDIVNFEVAQNGGYARIGGYERYSGLPSPSDASFVIVQVSTFVNVPSVGDEIEQASSGASGTVAHVNNAVGAMYMVVTATSGAFDTSGVVTSPNDSYTVTEAGGALTVTEAGGPFVVPLTATTIGTAIVTNIQLTSMLNAQYLAAAAEIYRDQIEAVPGSGAVLGVVHMIFNNEDFVYAFRANVLGTAVNIWRDSDAGWVQVPLFNVVTFTAAGTAEPEAGETLNQGPASATIMRVMIDTGTIAGGSAAGTMVVTTPNLGFSAGAATTSGGTTLTLGGAQTPIVIQPGGRYEFDKYNFSGQLATREIYGCDGVNKAFAFDGTTYAPINTGAEPSVPSHVCCHKNHLFLSYESSLVHSGPGTPFRFSAIDNGGEIATGDAVTDMITLPGAQTTAAMGVWMRSTTGILYGTDLETFNFVTFNGATGANPRSVQNLYDSFAFPDIGIVTMQTSLNYGNFLANALTKNIQPFIVQQRTKIATSSVQRTKGQYRVFFTDGYGLYLTTMNQTYLGAAIVQFLNPVHCIDNDTTVSGEEVSYFGSSDSLGYVYQLDKGPSFDGENLFAYFIPAWDYFKSPEQLKSYKRARIEIQGNAYAAISFNYGLGDNNPLIGQQTANTYASAFSPAQWDNATWDNFYWDGQTTMPTYAGMVGTANDMQPIIGSSTNYIQPFTVSSATYQYFMRRLMRGM